MKLDTTTPDSGFRLSVCIPTYNRPVLLRRALVSVLGECSPDVEIVVCDNSTDDASARLCRQLLQLPSVQHRYMKNEPGVGPVENQNLCYERSTGEWILILHDDDYLLPGGLSAMVHAAATADGPCKAMLFGVDVVDENGRVLQRQQHTRERNMGPREALLKVLSDSSFVRVPAMVVRRDTYRQLGGFATDVGTAEDFEMWCRIFARHGVRCMPQVTSAYTVHTEALTTSMFDRSMLSQLEKIFGRAAAEGVIDDAVARRCQRRFFHQFILGGAYRQIRQGDRATARRIMKLFDLPEVRRLGVWTRWTPVRAAFSLITLGAKSSV